MRAYNNAKQEWCRTVGTIVIPEATWQQVRRSKLGNVAKIAKNESDR